MAAGGIGHFAVDAIFEEDGKGFTVFLRWAIGTGHFFPGTDRYQSPTWFEIILNTTFVVALMAGPIVIHLRPLLGTAKVQPRLATAASAAAAGGVGGARRGSAPAPSLATGSGLPSPLAAADEHGRVLASAAWVLALGALYLAWGVTCQYLYSPRIPLMGEEADLGALSYVYGFVIAPQLLLFLSIPKAATGFGGGGGGGGAAAATVTTVDGMERAVVAAEAVGRAAGKPGSPRRARATSPRAVSPPARASTRISACGQ